MNMILEAKSPAKTKVMEAVKPVETEEETRNRIQAELFKLGFTKCPPEILDRLVIFENFSKFNEDSRMVKRGVENTLDNLNRKNKLKLTPEQKCDVVLASFFSDIGKSSSSDDQLCQLAVIKLFSVGQLEDPNKITVEETLKIFLPDEVEAIISNLSKIGITRDMSMRNFFDMHAFWTKDVLDQNKDVFSKRMVEIASSHHVVQGINPCGIDEEKIPNDLKYCIYALMAVDKYQARVERSKATHEEAIDFLKNDPKGLKKYASSPIMISVIKLIDELGKAEALFKAPEAKK